MNPRKILTALVVSAVPAVVWAVCLLDDYSVRAEYKRSDAVILGVPESERAIPDRDEVNFIGGTLYRVSVKRSFRGSLHGTVQVFSENSSGRFPMERGKQYILFLSPAGQYLSADNCGNSGLVAEKQKVVSEVQVLRRQAEHE